MPGNMIFREDLEEMKCECDVGSSCAAHDTFIAHGRCHIKSPTWAEMNKRTGIVTIRCAECEAEIFSFLVARKENMS